MNHPVPDPIAAYRDALAAAFERETSDPTAATLATVSEDGKPSARVVLIKGADERGFSFYTNLGSRKASELKNNPDVALCVHWPAGAEQIRIEGRVSPVSDAEADAYFASRVRGSQIGAWASQQSATLSSREALEDAVREVEARYVGKPVPRPPHWSGFLVAPTRIEFWFGRDNRLHDRFLYTRHGDGWSCERLYP